MDNENRSNIILTSQQVAEYLRISLSTVHHLTRAGKLKSVKVGKQWRYLKDDIDSYLQSGFDPKPAAPSYEGEERRAHIRTKCMIQGHVVIMLPDSATWEGGGNVLNLSAGGLLFETRDSLTVKDISYDGAPANVKIYLDPVSAKEYDLEGKVRRIQTGHKTLVGIQFNESMPQLSDMVENTVKWN